MGFRQVQSNLSWEPTAKNQNSNRYNIQNRGFLCQGVQSPGRAPPLSQSVFLPHVPNRATAPGSICTIRTGIYNCSYYFPHRPVHQTLRQKYCQLPSLHRICHLDLDIWVQLPEQQSICPYSCSFALRLLDRSLRVSNANDWVKAKVGPQAVYIVSDGSHLCSHISLLRPVLFPSLDYNHNNCLPHADQASKTPLSRGVQNWSTGSNTILPTPSKY